MVNGTCKVEESETMLNVTTLNASIPQMLFTVSGHCGWLCVGRDYTNVHVKLLLEIQICDMIKGNESLVEKSHFLVSTPLSP